MRYIEIDGERIEVRGCLDCPFYEDRDVEYYCKHPSCSTIRFSIACGHYREGKNLHNTLIKEGDYDDECPLREVKE